MKHDPSILSWVLAQPPRLIPWYSVALARLEQDERLIQGMIGGYTAKERSNLPRMLLNIEMEVMQEALDASLGNITDAADVCGIKRSTFSMRAHRLGLRLPSVPLKPRRNIGKAYYPRALS